MSAFGNRAKFREKTRELAANFIEFRCTAHAELGWRAPRALHNMHGVATVLGEVSAAFGGEIARCRRLKIAQNFARKTRGRAATFVQFRCTAHAELGRRAPRALHNTHVVGRVFGAVSAAFGCEFARCRRLELAQNFARKRAHVL